MKYAVNNYSSIRQVTKGISTVALMSLMISVSTATLAQENLSVSHSSQQNNASGTATVLSEADRASAQSRLPMLTSLDQLPANARKALGLDNADGVVSNAYGAGAWPFTTKRYGPAWDSKGKELKKSFRPLTGKLWMRFGESWYVCTASVIDKNLLVTAAHCVHNYGQMGSGLADEVVFEAARHEKKAKAKTWKALDWYIPSVYYNGNDTCTSPGVVCENDIAIVVIDNKKGIADKLKGHFNYAVDDYSYIAFMDGECTQITQLGYPVALDGGVRMIRTDSLGCQDAPSNVVIGSDQTGGSSGGPWFVNFGTDYVSASSTPTDAAMNIMAVTSWGYTSNSIKIQGSSRFARNTTYTSESNISSLHGSACSDYPTACYP